MKPLKPTYRRKKRRVIVEFIGGRPQSPVKWAINKIKKYLGLWGLAHASVKVENAEERLIITVTRGWEYLVRASIVMGSEEFLPVTYVTGTLEAARRKGFL